MTGRHRTPLITCEGRLLRRPLYTEAFGKRKDFCGPSLPPIHSSSLLSFLSAAHVLSFPPCPPLLPPIAQVVSLLALAVLPFSLPPPITLPPWILCIPLQLRRPPWTAGPTSLAGFVGANSKHGDFSNKANGTLPLPASLAAPSDTATKNCGLTNMATALPPLQYSAAAPPSRYAPEPLSGLPCLQIGMRPTARQQSASL